MCTKLCARNNRHIYKMQVLESYMSSHTSAAIWLKMYVRLRGYLAIYKKNMYQETRCETLDKTNDNMKLLVDRKFVVPSHAHAPTHSHVIWQA